MMGLELREESAGGQDAARRGEPAVMRRVEAGGRILAVVLRDVRLVLVALWLGGAVFFGAAVAPSAFAVLRERGATSAGELAGSIVTRTLSIVNLTGFALGLVLLATAFLFTRAVTRRAIYAETVSLALVAIATAAGHWIINARLLALRLAMKKPIDEVPQNDPLRTAFNNLHGYSVLALGVATVCAAVALLLIARRARTD